MSQWTIEDFEGSGTIICQPDRKITDPPAITFAPGWRDLAHEICDYLNRTTTEETEI
jgi:hypothetical protein